MTKKNPYSYLLLLFVKILFLLSCVQNNNKQGHLVSTVISSDSVTIYSGQLGSNTSVQKIALDEKKFREVLTDKKNKADKPITVLLKLSPDGGQAGIVGSIYNVIQWSNELGVTNFIIGDDDEKNVLRFNSAQDTRRCIDSGFRSPPVIDLNIPKDEDAPITQVNTKNALICIVFSSDSIYCYKGSDLKKGSFYSLTGKNNFRNELLRMKKTTGENFTVIIKPTESATYKSTVDMLDEMAINKIKIYSIVKLSESEEYFLKTKSFEYKVPEPVAITTPASIATHPLPDDNAMIIEIKADESVWYKIIEKGNTIPPVLVKKPVAKTLKEIIAGYEKSKGDKTRQYLIKGNNKAKFPVFEQIIIALKENNVFKYNLITAISE